MIADSFFRLVHHPHTGQPRLAAPALGAALAAGLLLELYEDTTVTFEHDRVVVRPTQLAIPHDNVSRQVLDILVAETHLHHPLKDWLRFLGRDASYHVGQRLISSGAATPRRCGWLWGRRTIVQPLDPLTFEGLSAHLSYTISRTKPMTRENTILAGLCVATGFHRTLLDGAPPRAHTWLHGAVAELDPPIRHLLDAVSTLVGDAVLTGRT